jgi:LAO/AO transport system kinase
MTTDLERTLAAFLAGERRAAARLITIVEDGGPVADRVLHDLYPRLRGVHRIGITGPPGVGKSTLVEALIRGFRDDGRTVGVVAVDPTSPFSGGAVLGDRVRMSNVALDSGVFIRSMATRGSLGGLALATKEVADVLDAFGCDVLLIETVGVGQSEVDVATATDTVIVAVSPESGDAIQTMKAGLMEIADILVVNKADRPGAAEMVQALRGDLALRTDAGWSPPIVTTIAARGDGVADLRQAIAAHREHLTAGAGFAERRRHRARVEIEEILRERLWQHARDRLDGDLAARAADVVAGRETPYSAAGELLAAFLKES